MFIAFHVTQVGKRTWNGGVVMKSAIFEDLGVAEAVAFPPRRASKVYRLLGKRIFDIAFALLILPLILPVLAVLWALTRLDGGPGFYTQVRVGQDGRKFNCFKIRSMVINADAVLHEMCARDPAMAHEWHVHQKLDNDPRITRVGAFVRATSLDELPQVFNILMGDMSFVGPRPFTDDQETLYRKGGGKAYFALRPGITGLWQVFGRSQTTFMDRVNYDETYERQLGFLSDLSLILRTVSVVLNRTGK